MQVSRRNGSRSCVGTIISSHQTSRSCGRVALSTKHYVLYIMLVGIVRPINLFGVTTLAQVDVFFTQIQLGDNEAAFRLQSTGQLLTLAAMAQRSVNKPALTFKLKQNCFVSSLSVTNALIALFPGSLLEHFCKGLHITFFCTSALFCRSVLQQRALRS